MNAKKAKEKSEAALAAFVDFSLLHVFNEIELATGRGEFSVTFNFLDDKESARLKSLGYKVTRRPDVPGFPGAREVSW